MRDIKCQVDTRRDYQQRVVAIGDHLYIVEGAVRWGLYDLLNGTLALIDKGSGELLNRLSQWKDTPPLNKRLFLKKYAKEIWGYIEELDISSRLFEDDTSVGENGLFFDLLWLEVTDICNERCIHCYAENGPMRKSIMPVNFAMDIISQGRKENFRKIQFVGGEPFAHRDLWKMVCYAHELGYPEIEIFTNLTLLKADDIKKIKSLGIKIATSLLGPNAEVHDMCTGVFGSFQRWYKNMKVIQAMGIEYRIGVVRMKQNEHFMKDIENFLRNEHFLSDNELFEPDDIRPSGRGKNESLQPSTPLDYGLYLTVNPRFFHGARQYNPCWRGEIAVTTNGDVFPCVFSRKLVVGNLKKERLGDVIERLKGSFWRITLDKIEKCRDCEFRYACMDCRALSLNTGKGLYGGPVRCNYNPYQ